MEKEKILPIQGIFFKDFANAHIPEQLKEMYLDKIYDYFLKGKKEQVVLDIGSNCGLFSFYAYRYSKVIYALEPSAVHFETLNFMLNFNQMNDKVVPIQKALALENGRAVLGHNDNITTFSLHTAVRQPGLETEDVETIRLDTLLDEIKEDRIDFMKMDIEGVEAEIIGSASFEKACKKIQAIVIELHEWNGFNPKQLFNTLADYGYKVRQIPSEAMIIGAER